ncbi:unnamed protein product [Allacma fusca]|uniref:Uncharacterized protein n=1 Tax=Allacma fusca TaxID=39272 RepID=A0A8J2P332_9HEXA|nr:unnamed protein product [Allacma fusca]
MSGCLKYPLIRYFKSDSLAPESNSNVIPDPQETANNSHELTQFLPTGSPGHLQVPDAPDDLAQHHPQDETQKNGMTIPRFSSRLYISAGVVILASLFIALGFFIASKANGNQQILTLLVPTETTTTHSQPERYATLLEREDFTSLEQIPNHPKKPQPSIESPVPISNDKDDRPTRSSTPLFPTETTTTHKQPEGFVTSPEMENCTSLAEVTHHRNKLRLSIGNLSDFPDLPEIYDLYLTINNSKDVRWENWFPQNGDKVIVLRLNGTFTIPDILHFLSFMNKLTTLCIYDLNGKACRKNFRRNSTQIPVTTIQSSAENLGAANLQLRRRLMEKLVSNKCK